MNNKDIDQTEISYDPYSILAERCISNKCYTIFIHNYYFMKTYTNNIKATFLVQEVQCPSILTLPDGMQWTFQ